MARGAVGLHRLTDDQEHPLAQVGGIALLVSVELPFGDLDDRCAVPEREQEPGVDDADVMVASKCRLVAPFLDRQARRLPVRPATTRVEPGPERGQGEQANVEGARLVEAFLVVAVRQPEVRRQVHDVVPVERVERHPPGVVLVVVGDAEQVRRRRPVERPDCAKGSQRVVAVDQRPVGPPHAEAGMPQLGMTGLLRGRRPILVEPGAEPVGRENEVIRHLERRLVRRRRCRPGADQNRRKPRLEQLLADRLDQFARNRAGDGGEPEGGADGASLALRAREGEYVRRGADREYVRLRRGWAGSLSQPLRPYCL